MSDSTDTSVAGARSPQKSVRIGFIGLGSQGGPMARRIAEAGFPTTLWARRPENLQLYADTPAMTASTPSELGRNSDLVCICVVDDAGVEAVLTGADGVLKGMAPGGAIAIHSTIHPETVRRLADVAKLHGVDVIDAPVSGGGPAVLAGRLLVMVGGEESTVSRFLPVFASYADPVVHLGPLGAGQVTKLLNNTVFAAHLSMAAGILSAGQAMGVDPVRLAEVMSHGSGDSFAIRLLGPMSGNLPAMSEGAGPLLRKDVRILADLLGDKSPAAGAVWDAADDALVQMNHAR